MSSKHFMGQLTALVAGMGLSPGLTDEILRGQANEDHLPPEIRRLLAEERAEQQDRRYRNTGFAATDLPYKRKCFGIVAPGKGKKARKEGRTKRKSR